MTDSADANMGSTKALLADIIDAVVKAPGDYARELVREDHLLS